MMLHEEARRARRDYPMLVPSETVIAETRFGTYEFTPENTILMPQGLVGFAEQRIFGIGNLPAPVPADFKLLQSLGEPPLSFIVMPVSAEQALLDRQDVQEACEAAGFGDEQVHLLFICTVCQREGSDGVDMTVNLRAPIVLDIASRQARQVVLSNNRYPLRQPLDRWDGRL